MANLAIKGHATRGEEVIEILEMLGGRNPHNYCADCDSLCFTIGKGTNIIYYDWVRDCYEDGNTIVFTLEEFLEKYPYKVGDKVRFSDSNTPFTISRIWWDNNASELICTLEEQDIDVSSVDLQPYKEETMEEKGILEQIDLTKELKVADEVEVILGDYEFVLKDGKTYFVKKKPKYPKTYKECFNICFGDKHHIIQVVGLDGLGNNKELFENFIKLKICRDAYWKIAGEQMGLGKPWKPYWSIYEHKFCLVIDKDKVLKECVTTRNRILAFPTKEIRDAFYENFKVLIEECKELL